MVIRITKRHGVPHWALIQSAHIIALSVTYWSHNLLVCLCAIYDSSISISSQTKPFVNMRISRKDENFSNTFSLSRPPPCEYVSGMPPCSRYGSPHTALSATYMTTWPTSVLLTGMLQYKMYDKIHLKLKYREVSVVKYIYSICQIVWKIHTKDGYITAVFCLRCPYDSVTDK